MSGKAIAPQSMAGWLTPAQVTQTPSLQSWLTGTNVPAALPRPDATFLNGQFGPLSPMQPIPIDQPDEAGEQPPPRRNQYPIGWNMPTGVPGSEGLKLASFAQLRSYADLYSVVRSCIQVRKEEILGIDWDIVPTDDAEKTMKGSSSRSDFAQRRDEAMTFFNRPDPEYDNYHSWMSALLEEIFVIDALSIYLHPSRMIGKGLLGSNVAALALLDGSTIRPLYSIHGTRPRPPAPAFQQYLYGVPRVDLMTYSVDGDLAGMAQLVDQAGEPGEYRGDELLYLPYTRRTWTPYGFAPVERALVPIATGFKRQQWALDYFTEGSIPGLFIIPGPTVSTPQQQRQLQDALNAVAGDVAYKHRLLVLPAGSNTQEMKDKSLSDAFDSLIVDQICMAFDVMPTELGVMPHNSGSGLGGKAVHDGQSQIQMRRATKPLLNWLKDNIFDFVLQQLCGQTDMQWRWEGIEPAEDEAAKITNWTEMIKIGMKSIDEARTIFGDQPWGLPLTSQPIILTGTGPVTLEEVNEPAAPEPNPPPDHFDPSSSTAAGGGDAPPAEGAVDTSDGQTPLHDAESAAPSTRSTDKAACAELDAFSNYLGHGKDPAKFIPKAATPDLLRRMQALIPDHGRRKAALLVKADVTGNGHTTRRDAALIPLQAAVTKKLVSAGGQLAAGKITAAAFASQGLDTMTTAYAAAYKAGVDHSDTDYSFSDDDQQAIDDRAAAQHPFLEGFAKAIASGISESMLGARADLYGSSVYSAYEQGYGTALTDGDSGVSLDWHTSGDGDVCDLCKNRDGQSFTLEDLNADGWPGDGDFGDRCEGGSNCRCFVELDAGS